MNKKIDIQTMVAEALEARKDDIIKNGIEGVADEVTSQVKWKLGSVIGNEIEKLFEDPEVKAKLAEEVNKVKIAFIETFASELQTVSVTVATEFAAKLQQKAIKNITEDSWGVRDIYKKIFAD